MSKGAFLVLFVSIGRLSEGFSNLIEVILGNFFSVCPVNWNSSKVELELLKL